MTRSVWKGPFVEPNLIKSTQKKYSKVRDRSVFRKVWSRRSCILPQFVDCFTQIYNGKRWIGLQITEEMVGHKFGEFASTRTKGRTPYEKGSTLKTKNKLKAKVK